MLDSTGFAALCAQQALFHLVYDSSDEKLDSILGNGLERVESHYNGLWVSRPGHVYLGTPTYLKGTYLSGLRESAPYAVLRIDVAKLDRQRINPDEDHFQTQNHPDCEQWNWLNGRHPCRVFHREFPPTKWIYEWATWLKLPIPSLGEWADQVGLGSNPAETRYSIGKGSIAYNGVVPPAAISLVKAMPAGAS